MSPFLIGCVVALSVTIAAALYRVWAGPTVFDRLVAVALVSVNGVVLLILLGVLLERPELYFDIALGFALLAFLLPIALGRYFERGIEDGAIGTGSPTHPAHDDRHTEEST